MKFKNKMLSTLLTAARSPSQAEIIQKIDIQEE